LAGATKTLTNNFDRLAALSTVIVADLLLSLIPQAKTDGPPEGPCSAAFGRSVNMPGSPWNGRKSAHPAAN
jgi:hypothetical protein